MTPDLTPPGPIEAAIEAAVRRVVAEPLRALAARLPQPDAPPGLGPWGFGGHADQAFGAVTYAQFGEDLILLNLFRRMGIERPSYLDIGAHHPLNCSNTALLYACGGRGVNVEANPELIAAFGQLRPEDLTLNIGVGPEAGLLQFQMIDAWSGRNTFDRATAERFVAAHPAFRIREVRDIPVVTLDALVAEHCRGVWPDLLSIDIEGLDLPVLSGSGLRRGAGPKLICAEAVSGNDHDEGDRITGLLRERGYQPVFRTLGNVLFSEQPGI